MTACHVLTALAAAATLLCGAAASHAGPLTPPGGPVAPTHKTLTQVEPRIPISLETTPGDADSVFRIAQPGSYYLTGNITGVAAKRGIEVSAPGVTIDLMGFDLVGVPGSLEGILATGGGVGRLAILNGTVRAWGSAGINLTTGGAASCRVVGIIASANGSSGIAVSSSSLVSGCVSGLNTGSGIQASFNCVITGCTTHDNGGNGISATSGSTITACAANNNDVNGISGGAGSTVSHCAARANTLDGIVVTSGSAVLDCVSSFNTGDGVRGGSDNLIRANTCANNGSGTGDGAGVHVTGDANRIEANACANADRGIDIDAAGSLVVRNSCTDNAVNYDIAAGNRFGPIIDITAAGTPAALGNAAASTLTSTDANANYAY